MNTEITIELEGVIKIECIRSRTGEKDYLTITNNKLALNLNNIYKIPITNKTLSLTDSNGIKCIGNINQKLDIRDVEEGFVFIMPIVHGVFINSGEVLGEII